ncbi:hypothetical protein P5V15_004538 [Pogonomyrmex californicus]
MSDKKTYCTEEARYSAENSDFDNALRVIRRAKLQTIGEDFCGLDVNTPLGGEEPMGATAVLTFETHLTAVAATSTGDYTVVFVGTNKGHLKKVSVWK